LAEQPYPFMCSDDMHMDDMGSPFCSVGRPRIQALSTGLTKTCRLVGMLIWYSSVTVHRPGRWKDWNTNIVPESQIHYTRARADVESSISKWSMRVLLCLRLGNIAGCHHSANYTVSFLFHHRIARLGTSPTLKDRI
jgi:hypothetical protein